MKLTGYGRISQVVHSVASIFKRPKFYTGSLIIDNIMTQKRNRPIARDNYSETSVGEISMGKSTGADLIEAIAVGMDNG